MPVEVSLRVYIKRRFTEWTNANQDKVAAGRGMPVSIDGLQVEIIEVHQDFFLLVQRGLCGPMELTISLALIKVLSFIDE